ncbi:MAG: hypothetical protein HRU34_18890 [Richelia sp.]|nr:hypothetical protein [Richelia sp.]CDN10824.1 hypothetical protein RintRC_4133 [Richelia intracellularis]
MESLHNQISILSNKLDAVYQVIQRLDQKVSQAFAECSLANKTEITETSWKNMEAEEYRFRANLNFNSEMEHKDILADGIYPETNMQAGEQQITPEIQLQRLTAQLTAAYNRIAALEEQLLLKRISS